MIETSKTSNTLEKSTEGRRLPSSLFRNRQGTVFTEYAIALGTVAVTVGLAIYALGVPLARSFYLPKALILLPIP